MIFQFATLNNQRLPIRWGQTQWVRPSRDLLTSEMVYFLRVPTQRSWFVAIGLSKDFIPTSKYHPRRSDKIAKNWYRNLLSRGQECALGIKTNRWWWTRTYMTMNKMPSLNPDKPCQIIGGWKGTFIQNCAILMFYRSVLVYGICDVIRQPELMVWN